jgi:hypothetical protein
MCSTKVVETTLSASLAGAAVGGVPGAVIGLGVGAAVGAGTEGKGPLRALEVPKPAKVKPEPDVALKERKDRFRALRSRMAGRPGEGRRSTIFSRPSAGQPTLKQKTGQ